MATNTKYKKTNNTFKLGIPAAMFVVALTSISVKAEDPIDPLTVLPIEVSEYIFSFVNPEDQDSIKLTASHWNVCAKDNCAVYISNCIAKRIDKLIEMLTSSKKPIIDIHKRFTRLVDFESDIVKEFISQSLQSDGAESGSSDEETSGDDTGIGHAFVLSKQAQEHIIERLQPYIDAYYKTLLQHVSSAKRETIENIIKSNDMLTPKNVVETARNINAAFKPVTPPVLPNFKQMIHEHHMFPKDRF